MADAYTHGLALLARRELCEAQLRERLARREHSPAEIDDAIDRLRADRSLDDARTARAFARTETRLRQRSRRWVQRRLRTMGIARAVADEAVAEVYADIDEAALVEAALDRRLRGGASPADPAVRRRLRRFLIAQGFDAGLIGPALAARARGAR